MVQQLQVGQTQLRNNSRNRPDNNMCCCNSLLVGINDHWWIREILASLRKVSGNENRLDSVEVQTGELAAEYPCTCYNYSTRAEAQPEQIIQTEVGEQVLTKGYDGIEEMNAQLYGILVSLFPSPFAGFHIIGNVTTGQGLDCLRRLCKKYRPTNHNPTSHCYDGCYEQQR